MIAITELDMANLFNYSRFLVVCIFKNVCEHGNDPKLYIWKVSWNIQIVSRNSFTQSWVKIVKKVMSTAATKAESTPVPSSSLSQLLWFICIINWDFQFPWHVLSPMLWILGKAQLLLSHGDSHLAVWGRPWDCCPVAVQPPSFPADFPIFYQPIYRSW